jgi:hypothetical protein
MLGLAAISFDKAFTWETMSVQKKPSKPLILEFSEKKFVFKKIRFFVWYPEKNPDPKQKIDFLLFFISFQKNLKFKIYYEKWTLRIAVVNG